MSLKEAVKVRASAWQKQRRWMKMSKRQQVRSGGPIEMSDDELDVMWQDLLSNDFPFGVASWARRRWGKESHVRPSLGHQENSKQRRELSRAMNRSASNEMKPEEIPF